MSHLRGGLTSKQDQYGTPKLISVIIWRYPRRVLGPYSYVDGRTANGAFGLMDIYGVPYDIFTNMAS